MVERPDALFREDLLSLHAFNKREGVEGKVGLLKVTNLKSCLQFSRESARL